MCIDKIIKTIDEGGLVIMPTDTVYGIMGDALNKETIKKVYEAKKRDYSKPLIILVSNYDMLKKYTENISDLEEDIIKNFLPGLLTIILEKNNLIDSMISAGSNYVGVRIPDNKDLIEIINKLDRPIISTSANISNNDTITNVNMIDPKLAEKIDLIVDGGEVKALASTIVKVKDNTVLILRDGLLGTKIRSNYDMAD